MTFTLPTEEQLAITRGVTEFLGGKFPADRFRTSAPADTARWGELADIGILGISLAEAEGGLGLTWVDDTLAAREAGRQLLSPVLISTVIAVHIAAKNGLSALRDGLLSGRRVCGIALTPDASNFNAIECHDGLVLHVELERVRLLEFASAETTALTCLDDSVQLAALPSLPRELSCVQGSELALGARLLAAAMLCGTLETTLDMAVGYARSRVQFGRPIGAFQAIKHRCADIALATELCWSQTLQAAEALTHGEQDARFHVLAAALLAGEEALQAARFNIQAHGGMGFTAEVDAHRLLKRTHVLHQLFGDPRAVPAALLDLPLEI